MQNIFKCKTRQRYYGIIGLLCFVVKLKRHIFAAGSVQKETRGLREFLSKTIQHFKLHAPPATIYTLPVTVVAMALLCCVTWVTLNKSGFNMTKKDISTTHDIHHDTLITNPCTLNCLQNINEHMKKMRGEKFLVLFTITSRGLHKKIGKDTAVSVSSHNSSRYCYHNVISPSP